MVMAVKPCQRKLLKLYYWGMNDKDKKHLGKFLAFCYATSQKPWGLRLT